MPEKVRKKRGPADSPRLEGAVFLALQFSTEDAHYLWHKRLFCRFMLLLCFVSQHVLYSRPTGGFAAMSWCQTHLQEGGGEGCGRGPGPAVGSRDLVCPFLPGFDSPFCELGV